MEREMVFSSVEFLFLFLPITILFYFLIGRFGDLKKQNIFLVFMSLLFYAYGEPIYVFLMLLSIIFNYFIGKCIWRHRENKRNIPLFFGVAVNLSFLFIFKYYGFFVNVLNKLLNMEIPEVHFELPIGISFYTFQVITYLVDVYRKEAKLPGSIIDMALYISFFPQLIAGPIVQYNYIDQNIRMREHSLEKIEKGICRFVIGLAKKVLLANNIGVIADMIMGGNLNYTGIMVAWLGIFSYTLQIYFDFSGYSDMAIGLGWMFGFSFPENFNYPYISLSIREFWRRWHITLSSFFKNYVYIPLGGNRKNLYRNLWIVFLLTGLWHGAAWTFIFWGLWHGFFSFLERKAGGGTRVPDILRRIYTLLIVSIGWVFFRMETISGALEYLSIMFGIKRTIPAFSLSYYLTGFNVTILVLGVIACVPNKVGKFLFLPNKHGQFVKILILILLIISAMFLQASSYNPFIYFQF